MLRQKLTTITSMVVTNRVGQFPLQSPSQIDLSHRWSTIPVDVVHDRPYRAFPLPVDRRSFSIESWRRAVMMTMYSLPTMVRMRRESLSLRRWPPAIRRVQRHSIRRLPLFLDVIDDALSGTGHRRILSLTTVETAQQQWTDVVVHDTLLVFTESRHVALHELHVDMWNALKYGGANLERDHIGKNV